MSRPDDERAHEALTRLRHDVGKYVSRIARNLPPSGPIPAVLGGMLVKDLYQTHEGRPASARFEALCAPIPTVLAETLRAELRAIDALEGAVRAGDEAAMRSAAAHALAVDRLLIEALK